MHMKHERVSNPAMFSRTRALPQPGHRLLGAERHRREVPRRAAQDLLEAPALPEDEAKGHGERQTNEPPGVRKETTPAY